MMLLTKRLYYVLIIFQIWKGSMGLEDMSLAWPAVVQLLV